VEVCLDDWREAWIYRWDDSSYSWVGVSLDVPSNAPGCHVLSWDLGPTIPDHAGRYRVVASPDHLPSTGAEPGDFDVFVRLAPAVVTQHPADTVVTGGETAEFSAAAAPPTSAGSPRARPQWQVMVDGTPWSFVDGATEEVWQAGTREADGTAFVRVAYTRVPLNAFQIAPEPAYTDPARLTVWASVALERAPRDADVPAGDEVTFDVGQVWGVSPVLQWEHLAPGGEWEVVPGADAAALTLAAGSGVAVDGARFRLCHENAFSDRTCSAGAVLTVTYTAPEVIRHPEPVTALPGEPVDFEAEAVHATSARWEIRAPGGEWVSETPTASDGDRSGWASLEVWAAADLDGTEYRAVFRNGDQETATDPARLTVLVLPPVDVSVAAVVRLVDRLPGW
jgi:hypothetical protein